MGTGTTTTGYPWPDGYERVMDGDNAIRALAEAVDTSAGFMHCVAAGQSVTAATVGAVTWSAATEDTCTLTKTSGVLWTITVPGLYVVTSQVRVTGSQATRGFTDLYVGSVIGRGVFTTDSQAGVTVMNRCVAGDTIKTEFYCGTATTINAGAGNATFLNVSRLGRSVGAAAPTP